MAMNEQERLVSDQINEKTASLREVDLQTAKLIGVLDAYRELSEEVGGDPVDALVNGIQCAIKEAGVITPAEVFLHGMAYAQHLLLPQSLYGGDYGRLVRPVWGRISIYDRPEVFLRQYRQVRPEVGHLFAAHWCQSEVRNGGFRQFFGNSTGVLAPEAVEGFRAIGLPECAELLAEAMRYFGVPYPRERVERQTRLSELTGECDSFAELNARFGRRWSGLAGPGWPMPTRGDSGLDPVPRKSAADPRVQWPVGSPSPPSRSRHASGNPIRPGSPGPTNHRPKEHWNRGP